MNMSIVALTNPKYPHNVGSAIRACSCWNIEQLVWTGNRVPLPEEWKNDEELSQYRIPREERMKGYKDVQLQRIDRFKELIESHYDHVPVAVEVMPDAENLFDFIHPPKAIYIFGPEDGGLDWRVKQHCHRFIKIPTAHCLNLACAVNVVLSHRSQQIYKETGICIELKEDRG